MSSDVRLETQGLGFTLYDGVGALPTAFVRSAVFANQENKHQVFEVLGMPVVKVERDGAALTETHLMVLAYLVSLVQEYDRKAGALVEFTAWDAVRGLHWTRSSQSVARLDKALAGLATTKVRIIQNGVQTQDAVPLVILADGWKEAKHRRIRLTAAFILDLEAYRTYVDLKVIYKLPNGAATRLYLLLLSEKILLTTWPMRQLAHLVGLASDDEYHVKDKLRQTLQVLMDGVRHVKGRGLAARMREDKGASASSQAGVALPVSSGEPTLLHTFEPIVAAYSFRRDRHGRWLVQLRKNPRVKPLRAVTLAQ
ncbi:hypothetical protein H0A66_18460 [Alcaligenaceae bacterium]|nr:hypothetical protein [Alcaligenaceae bacterium]